MLQEGKSKCGLKGEPRMKAHTARQILCNEDMARKVAKAQGKTAEAVKKQAKSLLNRLHKRERRARC